MQGFDIKKQEVKKEETFPELKGFSKRYFVGLVFGGVFWALLVHMLVFFGSHFLWFESTLDRSLGFYVTWVTAPELLAALLLTSVFLVVRYFLSALFREKKDYVTIHAWYVVILLYAVFGTAAYVLLAPEPPFYWTGSLVTMFVGVTMAHILALFFRD